MARTPYASITDVGALLPYIPTFTATSKPNATQVHSYLIHVSNEADAALALADYTVPVATGATVAGEYLRTAVAIGAAGMAAAAMPQGKDSKHESLYRNQWLDLLRQMRQDETDLPDADRDTGRSAARFYVAPVVDDITSASPYFVRGPYEDR